MKSRSRDRSRDEEGLPKPSIAAILFCLAGLVLVGVAAFWDRALSPETFWTQEQYEQRKEAASLYHRLAYEKPNSSEAAAAKERYEHHQVAIAAARAWNGRSRNIVRWSGVGLIAIGALVQFRRMQNS